MTVTAPPPLPKTPLALVILDGLGLRDEREGNAVAQANTPTLDRLFATCPHATLKTFGPDVGLPEGQMGNSEVGHMNIGAGRVVWMDLPRIDQAIGDGSFAKAKAVQDHIAALRKSGGVSHILGLLSPGGVHSHQRHMAYLARLLASEGIPVALHLFTDGRDVAPMSAPEHLTNFLDELGTPKGAAIEIATITGRYYALDRDNRWERVGAAHAAIVEGKGERAITPGAAIKASHYAGATDEFIEPTVIGDYRGVRDGDGLFCVNFRSDRAREILAAIADPAFDTFARRPVDFADIAGMVEYSERHNAYMSVVIPPTEIKDSLGEVIAAQGLQQLRLAETEKYPHVTFFFNGGEESPMKGETRFMAQSPKVATYDLQPEMAAADVTERLVAAIRSGAQDFIVVNYANPDMVGHTGDLAAAIRAVETVDAGLGDAVAAMEEVGGRMLIFADHGNCETMIDPVTGGPHTAHTLNDVPLILVGADIPLRQGGRLADIAPTALALLGIEQPKAMTGVSLLDLEQRQVRFA